MMMDKLIETQSIIITLDVDAFLFDKLQQIVQNGFSVVEINCVDQAIIAQVLNHFPMLRVGAGNIVNTEQLEICYQAGVHFVTSPGFLPAIAQTAAIYSINYFPGVATMSEAMQAIAVGCHHVRPFPASLHFCTLLNKYLPLLRLFPAEVELDEVEHFLNLPAVVAASIINPELKQLQAIKCAAEAMGA